MCCIMHKCKYNFGGGRGEGMYDSYKILGNTARLKQHLPYLINQFPPLIFQSTLLCLGLSSQASGFLGAPLLDPSKKQNLKYFI